MRTLGRILTASALAPWLVVSSALAPEHVHEAGSADHHPSVAHRHFSPHEHPLAEASHHARADASHLDHDGAEVEDPDEQVVWLDQVAVAEAAHSFPVTLFVVSTHVDVAPEPLVRVAVAADEATLPHGPPRSSASLRAPPSVLPLF
jgi:hypothetical protein